MIKTIKLHFNIEYNRYDIQLIGAMTHPMKGTIDYMQKSIEDASRIFDVTFHSSIFEGITNGHAFVFDVVNIEAYQAWSKVLFANCIQDQVMRGVLSMPLAKKYIKLEYPELVTVVSDVGPGFKYMSEVMKYIPKENSNGSNNIRSV